MNRELIVTLLQKDIQELEMMTEGFMEMHEYPKPILLLAQRKTEDIQKYIQMLGEFRTSSTGTSAHHEVQELIVKEEEECPSQENTTPLPPEPFIETPAPVIETALEINSTTNHEIVLERTEDTADSADVVTLDELDENVNFVEEPEEEINEVVIESLIEEDVEEDTTLDIVETDTAEDLELTFPLEEEKNNEVSTLADLSEKTGAVPTRNEILARASNTTVSSFANKPITDIKQAISISERFRFQRELFRGNGEDMNKTLTYLNQLATFEEAQSFLQSKYGWISENETAIEFYQIVKRLFI